MHYYKYGYYEGRKCCDRNNLFNIGGYCKLNIKNKIKLFLYRFVPCDIKANIAVVVHLYYMESWGEIRTYLRYIDKFNCDFYFTYCLNSCNEKILNSVRREYPNAIVKGYENKGFDVGPFVDILSIIDLKKI